MSSIDATADTATKTRAAGTYDMKLEVVSLPVSDVDRAKSFYERLGWRCDTDIVVGEAFRAVQLTPPHSACSIAFGKASPRVNPARSSGCCSSLRTSMQRERTSADVG
jgi:hypothetical protein